MKPVESDEITRQALGDFYGAGSQYETRTWSERTEFLDAVKGIIAK